MPRIRFRKLLAAILAASLPATSCKDAPRPGPLAIAELHSGAREMALDGFQFDKPRLAWPFDSGTPTSAAYLELLQQNNRLAPQTAATLASTSIANLSDSDPAETAFASIPAKDGVIVIRKDGLSRTFPDIPASATFAPPPPRTPAWLP